MHVVSGIWITTFATSADSIVRNTHQPAVGKHPHAVVLQCVHGYETLQFGCVLRFCKIGKSLKQSNSCSEPVNREHLQRPILKASLTPMCLPTLELAFDFCEGIYLSRK